jgi:hypothetical protein
MKALACLAAVCLIIWCAVDIAIKVELAAGRTLPLVRVAGASCSTDTSGIERSLDGIAGSLSAIETQIVELTATQLR